MRERACHSSWLNYGKTFFLLYVVPAFLLTSCDSARRVSKGQYLLSNNTILYRASQPAKKPKSKLINNKITALPGSEITKLVLPPEIAPKQLMAYIQQKPNTKILLGLIPMHLFVYNLVDPEKMKEKRLEKDQKVDRKNKAIAEKNKIREQEGKKLKKYKSKTPGTFSREWVRGLGEPPVILDSSLIKTSVDQITKYMHSKGYFQAKVSDSVHVLGNRASVFYIVRAGKPYKVRHIKYQLDDPALGRIIYPDSVNCLIDSGSNYDEDVLKAERDRITSVLKHDGYYAFSKEYVHYEVDTTLASHQLDITIGIKKYAYLDSAKTDSVIEIAHQQYYIRNVYIQLGYNPAEPNYTGKDSLVGSYIMQYTAEGLKYHPAIILKRVFVKKGDMYQVENVEGTYTALTQMGTFRYVNVRLVEVPHTNQLDCYIQLMPNTKYSLALEGVVNNTGGDKGVQGDIAFQNNNFEKGASMLGFKIKGGWQAQTLLSSETNAQTVNKNFGLNTIDIGPEITLNVPRALFPFTIGHYGHYANPQTAFKFNYDFQRRPDYKRNIATLAYTFDFNETPTKHWTFKPIEVNFINAVNTTAFINALDSTHDYFLLNSFTTHAVTDMGASFIFNNQVLNKIKSFSYLRIDGEVSGLLMHYVWDKIIQGVTNNPQPDKLFGTPYSHYARVQADWRHYFVISKDEKVVVRGLVGAGLPGALIPGLSDYGQELPFDKSFWAGGANDIRAWNARTLGPGGNNQTLIVDQVGDIKIEGNLEYRVNLVKFLGFALFADAGNVWLYNKNPAIPHGEFELTGPASSAFYNQIALGTGVGLRFDFTYFVFRVDLGVPVRDPAKPVGHEWLFDTKRTVLNIGIGYPF